MLEWFYQYVAFSCWKRNPLCFKVQMYRLLNVMFESENRDLKKRWVLFLRIEIQLSVRKEVPAKPNVLLNQLQMCHAWKIKCLLVPSTPPSDTNSSYTEGIFSQANKCGLDLHAGWFLIPVFSKTFYLLLHTCSPLTSSHL